MWQCKPQSLQTPPDFEYNSLKATIQTSLAVLGMGLGKDLQGMANKLEATANKGKSGLGLGHTYTLTPTTTPDYSPQPDTAILTNDHAALTFEEMEWWRIMEQRKPAKLLRSKFLPQDDILLALRTAREISQAWHRDRSLNSPDDKVTDLRTSDSKDSSAEGGWDVPLLVQTPKTNNPSPTVNAKSVAPGAVPGSPGAAPNSPEAFCLHQAPCLAPQGVHHSRSFWNMASLDSAFNICSSLAAMQQPHAKLNILDLSVNECGATEYVMTHGGVRIHSAQVMSGAAAQKLQGSCSHVAGTVQALLPSALSAPGDSAMQEASDALRTHVTDGTPAQTELPSPPPTAAVGSAAVAELPDTASLPGSPAADRQELDLKPLQPSPEAAHQADAAAVTHADVTDSTHVQTAAAADQHIGIANPSAAYSLNSYELLKAGLKAAHLVIGSLSLNNGQGTGPIGREISQTKGRTEGQHGEGSGQGMVAALCPQERVMQHEGVMETEYADDYRARLLRECAVALSSLQTGTAFLTRHVVAKHDSSS